MEHDQSPDKPNTARRPPLEQGQAHWSEAAAAAEPRLVHPDKAADGGSQA